MKRLLDETDPTFDALKELVVGAERHQPSPFAKRLLQARISRAVSSAGRRPKLRPGLLGIGAVLIAATAAAAGYSFMAPQRAARVATVLPDAKPSIRPPTVTPRAAPPSQAAPQPSSPDKSSARLVQKPRPGEDPSQVAEAVRALRKQGDAARAQALLDQYLKANPRGALAEDALALSIEAAAARKDPRAAEYARRYLARYPHGRSRALAQSVLSR